MLDIVWMPIKATSRVPDDSDYKFWLINGFEHLGWYDKDQHKVIGQEFTHEITDNVYWLERTENLYI
jgi:hypothetical protein